MSPNQQFEERSSYKQDHWEYFSFLSIAMYKWCNPNMPNLPISQVGYSFCLMYYWIFIELCPITQQKRRRPDATTYSRRRTNITFYRPAKIILCIWRVGNRIFRSNRVRTKQEMANKTKSRTIVADKWERKKYLLECDSETIKDVIKIRLHIWQVNCNYKRDNTDTKCLLCM